MKLNRLLAILLAALLLPLGFLRTSEPAGAETEPDIWVQIERYENKSLEAQGVTTATAAASNYGVMADGIAALVETHGSYAAGTLFRNGESVFWDDVNGMGCGWVPNARQKIRANATGADPKDVAAIETVSYASRGGYPYSSDVAVFGPYYGVDSSFSDQYRNEGNSIAQAIGGVCRVYSGAAATIDAVAHELEVCGTVIFDSHGNTDYSRGNDYTSQANTSYLCLTSADGVTSADTATVQGEFGSYKHAFLTGGGAFVDGTAIANHMSGDAPHSLLWMAICLGMATDGMEAPLHGAGVEVVYGYSQSVTFAGDYRWEAYFWDKMKDGADVAEAIAYMKQKGGYKDPYESSYPAFPIVVSSEDAYPGHGNVDARQTVYSSWTLFPQFTVTAVSNDTSLGTVSVSGTSITAVPKTGCAVVGYEVISGAASVTQNGDGLSETLFSVRAESDCTIRINFAKRAPVRATFVTPDGVSCAAISGYTGDTITLPTPSGTPTANAHAYAFYGWVETKVSDTSDRPDCLFAGDSVVLSTDRTFYALYFYAEQDGAPIPSGTYQKLFAEPSDWAGKAVLTYDGSVVLSANTNASSVGTASAAVAIGNTGIKVVGDTLTNVPDNYLYEIEAVGNGYYTIRMEGSGLYLCYTSGTNKLSATKTLSTAAKSPAYWALSWQGGSPVFTNAQTASATLCFDTEKQCFTCKKNNTGEPLTVFAVPNCSLFYTTELTVGSDPTPTPTAKPTATPTAKPTATPTPKPTATPTPTPTPAAVEATVEWNKVDVQFRGDTPYVIANGSAQTPRFTVKNAANGSVIDPANYDYEYKENTLPGTGYLFVTLKGAYTGSASGWFKIYLPATKQTKVENIAAGIRITWAPVDGAAGYVIYRRAWSTTTNGWTNFERWWNVTGTEWIDGSDAAHGVYAGTRYQYGVKAYFERRLDPIAGTEIGGNVNDPSGNYNLGEVGPLKTTVRITTRVLNEVEAGDGQITVRWAPSGLFTGTEIVYATDANFSDAVTVTVDCRDANNQVNRELVITGLTSGKTYYVRVRSYHEFEGFTYFGEWSNVLTGTVK